MKSISNEQCSVDNERTYTLVICQTLRYQKTSNYEIVKQKRWPDLRLNPGPSRHIPDALTTELSGLYQQIN